MASYRPELPTQPEITRDTVAEALEQRPRRICFSSSHQTALKHSPGARWVGSFSVPFRQSVYPIFYEMTGLALRENTVQRPEGSRTSWWRSIRDDDEFEAIQDWIQKVSDLVFLRDQLALSICLAEHQVAAGGRSAVGELEYQAKYHQDDAAIGELTERTVSAIKMLPHYNEADMICAIPPRQGKGFDLPTLIADQAAESLEIPDLSSRLTWRGKKPSLKEAQVDEKWDVLESVGLDVPSLDGETIILIDDLYQSGITIQYVASELIDAGASKVLGLALVKSRRDSDNQ